MFEISVQKNWKIVSLIAPEAFKKINTVLFRLHTLFSLFLDNYSLMNYKNRLRNIR